MVNTSALLPLEFLPLMIQGAPAKN